MSSHIGHGTGIIGQIYIKRSNNRRVNLFLIINISLVFCNSNRAITPAEEGVFSDIIMWMFPLGVSSIRSQGHMDTCKDVLQRG